MSFVKLRGVFIVILMTALGFGACSSGGTTGNTTISTASISITPSPAILVKGGSTVSLSASLTLSSGRVDDTAVFTWLSGDTAIVTVDANGIATGVAVGVATITASADGVTGSVSVGVVSAELGASSLRLFGSVAYEDKLYNLSGFTGTLEGKPIRRAIVEVVAIDGFKVIGTTVTDASGNYDITVDNSDRRGGVYLRVVSKTGPSQTEKIKVLNNSTEKALLSFASPGLDDSTFDPFLETQDILVTADSVGGAFNIIDVMSDASVLVQNSGPCPGPNDCIPPLVTVYWEPGSAEGTFFAPGADAISILGGGTFGGDTDEYDDVVIIHEYAHFILSKFSQDDSPGGPHVLSDNGQDIRLSWSEGWANFFAYAVLESPLYVDTVGTAPGNTLISFDNEDYSGASNLSTLAIYTTNEIAVAGVLWDVIDGKNPADGSEGDNLNLSFIEVFQTVLNFPSFKPTTLETFWTTFLNDPIVENSTAFQDILQGRTISLFQDATETLGLNLESLSLNIGAQTHTLYQAGADPTRDIDRIPFSVSLDTTYTVRTFDLSNGADTFLTIRSPSEVIATNDNASNLTYSNNCGVNVSTGTSTCPANNGSNLSSSVTFTAQEGETFTAEVTRSENAPPSAGLLGAYKIDLKINP